jgi:ribosome biogenesis protein ERB1
MGSKLTEKKRKAREPESDSESDNELANGLFDGVLSQSEDEEDYIPSDDGADADDVDDSESESEGSDGSEVDEEDDDILSDDIPSDVDGEEEINKLVKQQRELEITEPGVDPKRKDDDGEEKNYKIERDANGGERYVYECVLQWGIPISGLVADWDLTAKSTLSTIPTTRTLKALSTRSETSP